MVAETKSEVSKSANEMYSKLSAYRVFLNIEQTGTNLEITENFGLQLKTSEVTNFLHLQGALTS